MKDFLISLGIISVFIGILVVAFSVEDAVTRFNASNNENRLIEITTCDLKSLSPLKTVCVNGIAYFRLASGYNPLLNSDGSYTKCTCK